MPSRSTADLVAFQAKRSRRAGKNLRGGFVLIPSVGDRGSGGVPIALVEPMEKLDAAHRLLDAVPVAGDDG